MTVAIVGGGLAGLAVAHRLHASHDVVVFEREPIAGGKIRSQHLDGYVFEWGPGSILTSSQELQALIGELGLLGAEIPAPADARKRFIYRDGSLHALPAKPLEALKMSLLSPLGKLRALAEPFVPRGEGKDEESVFAFMRRRFGHEVAERLVSPALLGISGGDAENTSLAAIFPRVHAMEAEHGSVIRGMMRGPRGGAELCTFVAGLQTLTDGLAAGIGDKLRCGVVVRAVEPSGSGWRIIYDGGATQADVIVIATPANVAATLVEGFDRELATQLRAVRYAPMRVVGVAFRAQDVPAPLDGFGFLVARDQGVRILGAFYTSSIAPQHAPAGTAYFRVFLGGAVDPGAAALDAQAALCVVLADLEKILGIAAPPIASHEVIWPEAIPQYTVGHRSTVAAIEELAARHARLALAGNAYHGLGLGDTVREAFAVARRVGAGA